MPPLLFFESKEDIKSQIQALLASFPWDDHRLDSPEGLASCWARLVGTLKPPSEAKAGNNDDSAGEIDGMEISRAFMTLKQMRIYRNPETIRQWLEWYVMSGGLRKSCFITKFSGSWDQYGPIVAQAFVKELKEEDAAWSKDLNDRCRREAGKTMPVFQFNSDYGEEEIERMREDLQASLPGDEAIVEAIRGVETFYRDLDDDSNYMQWIASLAKAVPVLGPYTEVAYPDRHLDFVRLAREDCGGDLDLFADQTRAYVANKVKDSRDWIIEQGLVGPRMIVFNWLKYAYYFDLAPGIKEIMYPDAAEGKDMPPEEDGDAP